MLYERQDMLWFLEYIRGRARIGKLCLDLYDKLEVQQRPTESVRKQ